MSENKFDLNRRKRHPAEFWRKFLVERKKVPIKSINEDERIEKRDLETINAFTLVIKTAFGNWQGRLNRIQLLVKESSREDLIEYLKSIYNDGKKLKTENGSFAAVAANAIVKLLEKNNFSQEQLLGAFKLPNLETEE